MLRWRAEEEALLKKYIKSGKSGIEIFHEVIRKGLVRSHMAVLHKLSDLGWKDPADLKRDVIIKEALRPKRIGYFDIEADALDAMFGTVLTWSIKERGKKTILFDRITQKELLSFKYDKRILQSLVDTLSKFDVIYTYYGGDRRYDFPMIRSRCVQAGIKFPAFGELKCVDLYPLAKNKLRLRGYSLKNVTKFFNIKGKTELEPEKWRRAKLGDKKALDYVLHHNKFDVIILEELHKKLENFTLDQGTSI